MRSSVDDSRIPGTNAIAITTKSKMFQPERKKSWGRRPYAAIRSETSITKKPRKIAFSRARVSPCSRSISS